MKRKLMFFMTFLFVGIGLVTAQTSRVTGVVTAEEDGLPVVGASVLVNGTTLGTITDIDGKFTITNVPSSSKTYSYFRVPLFSLFLPYLIVNQTINTASATRFHDSLTVIATLSSSFSISVFFFGQGFARFQDDGCLGSTLL